MVNWGKKGRPGPLYAYGANVRFGIVAEVRPKQTECTSIVPMPVRPADMWHKEALSRHYMPAVGLQLSAEKRWTGFTYLIRHKHYDLVGSIRSGRRRY